MCSNVLEGTSDLKFRHFTGRQNAENSDFKGDPWTDWTLVTLHAGCLESQSHPDFLIPLLADSVFSVMGPPQAPRCLGCVMGGMQ